LSQTVWRIGTDTPAYEADDLSGAGAKVSGGRWNAAGVAIVYTSQTRALACLETVVHLNAGGLPLNRYLVEVTVPDDLWSNVQMTTSTRLPIGWDAEPAGRTSIEFGTNWIRSGTSALFVVPSVIVPKEFNVLINPQHPGWARITAAKVRRWLYDLRLTKTV
jgi:RES domain-containing protein